MIGVSRAVEYRDYQLEAKEAVFSAFDNGCTSALVVAATGTGKTLISAACIEEALKRGKKTLFVAHREILIEQAYKTFQAVGFNAAVEMGNQNARKQAAIIGSPDVVVGSVQSLQGERLMSWNPEEFGLVILDECHRSLADGFTKTLNWFRSYNLLGITATPTRGDERNLGSRFEAKAYDYGIRRAIKDGWLVPIKTRECRANIDLRGVKTLGGDLSLGEVAERIGPKIEELARHFMCEIEQRPAVCFLPDVGSAMFFADTLSALGISAKYVAGEGGVFGMPKSERKAILKAFDAGEFQVICCCELLIEGWDSRKVEAVGILRPTLQSYRYTQMVGRGTRPSPETGKTNVLIIDFDWTTDKDCKDLCSTVHLFDDGSLNEEVFAVAKEIEKKIRETEEDVNPEEVIEEAEKIVRTRDRFMVRLTGKAVEYQTIEYDPVGVSKILDVKLNRKYDLDRRGTNPASAAQLSLLQSMGMTTPEGLSKWGASKMIDKIQKRRKDGLASVSQVKSLLGHGVSETIARTMDRDAARDAVRELSALRPVAQKLLF